MVNHVQNAVLLTVDIATWLLENASVDALLGLKVIDANDTLEVSPPPPFSFLHNLTYDMSGRVLKKIPRQPLSDRSDIWFKEC